MSKRTIYHVAITLLLLGLALWSAKRHKDTAWLSQYASEIGAWLAETETEVYDWAGDKQAFLRTVGASEFDKEKVSLYENERRELEQKDYTILLHRGDTIVYWSNNMAIPEQDEFPNTRSLPERAVVSLRNGYFLVIRRPLDQLTMTALLPIRFTLTGDINQRQHLFPADGDIPNQVSISLRKTDWPIRVGNTDLCWLQATERLKNSRLQWLTFGFSVLFLVAFFSLVNRAAIWAAAKYRTAVGSAVLAFSVGGMVWLVKKFDVYGHFDALSIFSRAFKRPVFGNSLGEWLLNIIVLLWLMVFFHREFKMNAWAKLPSSMRIVLGVLYNLATMMSIVMVVFLFQGLIFDSRINFDFDNILNLDRYSLLAIVGIILLLAGLFLFSHRMMRTIFRIELTIYQRAISLMFAAAVMLPICSKFPPEDLDIPAMYIVAFSLVYVVAFDFFIGKKQPGFGWIISWLSLFSMFSALLLYHFNDKNDFAIRRECAQELAKNTDEKLAEPFLETLLDDLKADPVFDSLMPPYQGFENLQPLLRHVMVRVFQKNYLFQHYRPNVFVVDDKPRVVEGMLPRYRDIVENNWEKGTIVRGNPDLRWKADSLGNFQYMLRRPGFRVNDRTKPANAYLFFYHEFPNTDRVYSERFYNTPFKDMPLLDRYDFGIYQAGAQAVKRGKIAPSLENPKNFPAPETALALDAPGRADLVYTSKQGITVVVGRQIGGLFKRMYLFSSLFTLLSVFMIVLATVNSRARILPDYYQFYITTKGSLAKRIQYWTVGLIIFSFVVIGVMTYRHFTKSARENELKRIEYRTSTMVTHLSPFTLAAKPSIENIRDTVPAQVLAFATSFATDAHFYAPDGELVNSTQENLFFAGLLNRKMDGEAYHQLRSQTTRETMVWEKSGSFSHQTKYVALRNRHQELLGFVGFPYLLSKRNISTDLSDFIGILATVYVFLLIIAGSITYYVAGSIIRPIELIARKIMRLRLDDTTNQRLEYAVDGQDELSTLIEEYNRMVGKLEDSKDQLLRLEREGAWKVMAQQVAHDIKNPLTTMKLSIQQFERVASSDPGEMRVYLKRSIAMLIAQIDSLAHIATEFSMFAKLDIQNKYELEINEVVENVFDLFAETKGLDFQLSMPDERLHIIGDRNHLMRVFNNLVINATQAIPSDRRGLIRVALYREEPGKVVVRVSDNAGGIPPEVAKQIFEPNFTTKTTGSGLGLVISKRIVELHDGIIRFESRENEGTDFFVELPIYNG